MPTVAVEFSSEEFARLQTMMASMGSKDPQDVFRAAFAAYVPQAVGDVAGLQQVQTEPGASATTQAPQGAASIGTQPIGHSTNAASEMNPAGVTTPAAPPMAQGMGEAAHPAVAPVPQTSSTAHGASGTSPAQTGVEPQNTSGTSTPNAGAARTAVSPTDEGQRLHDEEESKPRE